jgi:hypothetical protein
MLKENGYGMEPMVVEYSKVQIYKSGSMFITRPRSKNILESLAKAEYFIYLQYFIVE